MIVLLTVLAGLAAFAYTRTQPKVYEASALVRIQQRATSAGETFGSVSSLELGERLAQTYARIVETQSMRDRVADILSDRGMTTEDVSISASPVDGVDLLSIAARSERPRQAAAVADAATVALRKFIKETGTLRDQIVVVDSAVTPSTPVSPRTKYTVALAIILALLFNGALALGREYFADRLPDVDEWPTRFGKPVLATVPTLTLRPYSTVLRSMPELEEPGPGSHSTHAIGGPTRWSLDAVQSLPEAGTGGG
jgi:capsular polysaccharide biosynthesis protein